MKLLNDYFYLFMELFRIILDDSKVVQNWSNAPSRNLRPFSKLSKSQISWLLITSFETLLENNIKKIAHHEI